MAINYVNPYNTLLLRIKSNVYVCLLTIHCIECTPDIGVNEVLTSLYDFPYYVSNPDRRVRVGK